MRENHYLALYLDAPLQSWGYQSRFDRRTTLSYPTRSGIIGMVCAAMGIDREDVDSLKQFWDLVMLVYVFKQAPRLLDYHTVGGGYDKKIQSQNIPRTADGKTGNTVLTYREYLQSSRFGVVLSGDGALIDRMAKALENPKWGIWLGRKSCIPADLVCQGVFLSEESALKHLEIIAGTSARRAIKEVDGFDEGTDTLNDVPLDFSEREFTSRRVYVE